MRGACAIDFTLAAMTIRSATICDAKAIAEVHVHSWQAAYRRLLPDDFLAAEQVLISVLALAVAGVFGIVALQLNITPPTKQGPFLLDWRLWAMSAASLGMGLLGTRIMLRGTRETTSYSFPAYRMMSLLAALGAAWVRGEIRFQAEYWANWTAALLACITIFLASRSAAAPKLKQAV